MREGMLQRSREPQNANQGLNQSSTAKLNQNRQPVTCAIPGTRQNPAEIEDLYDVI
jgi:hypothetical protein